MDVRWEDWKEVDRKRRKGIDDIMAVGGRELIDTLWNVNADVSETLIDGEKELIDTLWNVNQSASREGGVRQIELIDTLWNVNDKGRKIIGLGEKD